MSEETRIAEAFVETLLAQHDVHMRRLELEANPEYHMDMVGPLVTQNLGTIIIDWNNNTLTGGPGIIWNGTPVGERFCIIDVLLTAFRVIKRRASWANVECKYFLGIAPDFERLLYGAYVRYRDISFGCSLVQCANSTEAIEQRAQGHILLDRQVPVIPLSILDREIVLAPLSGPHSEMHKVAPWLNAYIGRLGYE